MRPFVYFATSSANRFAPFSHGESVAVTCERRIVLSAARPGLAKPETTIIAATLWISLMQRIRGLLAGSRHSRISADRWRSRIGPGPAVHMPAPLVGALSSRLLLCLFTFALRAIC